MPETLLFAIGALLTAAVGFAMWLVGLVDDGESRTLRASAPDPSRGPRAVGHPGSTGGAPFKEESL